nr:retrovirus-related Pol polyprotein from transposon TNT 1-94 [Tanacetum cinerariifolium]
MLNKENYVPWSSRLLRYAKSRPNGKLIHNFIINGPYVRRMILEPGDLNREVPVNKTFHVQTDDELIEKELKQLEADDQAIQNILLGLSEDIYATVDSCKTAREIWLRVQQMMKGSDIGIQEKKAKTQDSLALMETSNNPYTFPVLHQDQSSFNQNYMQQPMPNPEDITDLTTAMNMALALMAKAFKRNYSTLTNNNQRISSNPRNRQIAQPGMNMGQDRQMQMVRGNGGNQFRQYAGQNVGNLNGNNDVQNNPNGNGNLVAARAEGNATGNNRNQIRCYNCGGVGHFARNSTVGPRRRDAGYLQTQLMIAQKDEAGIQLQAEEFDLMAAAADLDEIEEVNANCILMANLQQASTSGTQTYKALVYDSDGSTEVHNYEDCYNNEIFNMFTQVEQYTELLKPILEPHQVPQNDNNVIFEVSSVEQSGGTVEQHPANVEEHEVKSTIVTLQRVFKQRMTLVTHNWSSFAHQELHKIVKDEIFPIVNQVDARVQNFEIQFLKEAVKFVGDFKSLAKGTDESPAKHKALELEIERLLRAVNDLKIVSLKRRNEYAKLWNDRYKKCEECKFDKISYDKAYNDMKQKIKQLQAQLGDLKGKSKDTSHKTKTRRPQPRSNTKNDRVSSASKSSRSKNKGVKVEEHHRKLLLSRNKKHMSSECNNVKLATQNVKSNVVCAMCKQCLNSVNHDVIQICLWCVDSGCSKHMTENLQLLINFVWKFLGTVRFGNDHVAAILGFSDLQWGNILITRVYFIEGLGHNLFSVGQFCDSDLEVAFRRNACFVRKLEGVDLLKGNRSTNLYTINLHEMASTSLICLMARAFSTKSWLWHQRLSHLNFGTINEIAKNDLVSGLPKFKYHKEHLCPSCEQGKSKRASHPPKPVLNSRQNLHLLHMDLYGLMRIASINGKRTQKIMETMNVTFDELSGMAFEQSSSKPRLQSMTSRQISSGLDLTYAPSTITTQQPTEGELDLLFEAMYDDYIGGQPSSASRTVLAAQAHQVRQTPKTSTSITDTAPTPTNSSSQATNFPNPSQDVDELNSQQQHAQQPRNQAQIQPEIVADNVPNAMFDANTFVNPFATSSTSAAESSSTQYVDPSNMYTFYQSYPHEFQ